MVHRLVVVILVLLAGCTAMDGASPEEQMTTTAQTTSATPVTPENATEDNTIEYSALSAEEQEAFDAAIAGKANFSERNLGSQSFDADLGEPFEDHKFLLKNETYFELETQAGIRYSSYLIGAEEGQPSEDDTVVAFEELPEKTKEPVRSAIQHGSYSTSLSRSGSMPPGLSGVEYVEYDGTNYSISTGVSDAWVQVWTADRVE